MTRTGEGRGGEEKGREESEAYQKPEQAVEQRVAIAIVFVVCRPSPVPAVR